MSVHSNINAPSMIGKQLGVLDKGFVLLVDKMGTDLTVANAARVSFKKRTDWASAHPDKSVPLVGKLTDRDTKILAFLAEHNHWTPFAHCAVTLHFKMPIFVRNQFMRSTVGIAYTEDGECVPGGLEYSESDPAINEVSRRYIDEEPEFYEPQMWRGRPPTNIKQGSSRDKYVAYTPGRFVPPGRAQDVRVLAEDAACLEYSARIDASVAPEQARICLPISMYTEFWATMSLACAARIYMLRIDSHAQFEVRQYAGAMNHFIEPLFPTAWKALTSRRSQETE